MGHGYSSVLFDVDLPKHVGTDDSIEVILPLDEVPEREIRPLSPSTDGRVNDIMVVYTADAAAGSSDIETDITNDISYTNSAE